MLVGAVDQNVLQPTDAQAKAKLQLAKDAGLGDAIRLTLTWARGKRAPEAESVQRVRSAVAAAGTGTRIYLSLYPFGSSVTPLSDQDQGDFTAWVVAIAKAVPQAKHFIIGNEPNLNRFWLPQFGPSGEDVAAVAVRLAPREVVRRAEGALARERGARRRPLARRLRQSGDRAARRTRRPSSSSTWAPPIARTAAPRRSWTPSRSTPTCSARTSRRRRPTATRRSRSPTTRSWSRSLGQAFDGTGQKGSTLPIVYDEFGVESTIAADKAGSTPAPRPPTVHPVDQATQALYYQQALRARVLPAERPGVPGLLAPRRERAPGVAVGRLLRGRDAEVEPGSGARRPPTASAAT